MEKLPKDVIGLIASFMPNLRERGGRYWTTLTITPKLKKALVMPNIEEKDGSTFVHVGCYSLIYNNNYFLTMNHHIIKIHQLKEREGKEKEGKETDEWMETDINKVGINEADIDIRNKLFESISVATEYFWHPARMNKWIRYAGMSVECEINWAIGFEECMVNI